VDTDVLIVGAGPTGLMLANQLIRRGIRPQIVDRQSGPSVHSKALGVQARTLEIYTRLGIAEAAVAQGTKATGANIWSRGRPRARVPFGDAGRGLTAFPYLLILGQDANERLLGDLLRGQGAAVQWNTELVGLTQQPDRVVATLRQADGSSREVTAAWVAGCDGARSVVRDLNRIEFVGAPYEHIFYVADTRVIGPMVPNELNVYLWRKGFHLFFPMRGGPDHWRVAGIVPPALRGRNDVKLEDLAPSIRQEAGAGLDFKECRWFSTYRIHHRHAERFREGRCFVLGDAAHIHSPVGAQGMNTGLQDAYNLAWKLALVITGRAGTALLESYGAERLPVARRLLSTTDRAFSIIVSDGKVAGVWRTVVMAKVMAVAMAFRRIRTLAFRTISQTGIRYRGGPLSESLPGLPDNAPVAGDRFPWLELSLARGSAPEDLYSRLDDIRFALVVIGQDLPPGAVSGFDDLVTVHRVPDDPTNAAALAHAGIPSVAFYLLRPDGYIGLSGTTVDAAVVSRYLRERIGLTPPT
jgi:2-polyprenyl-6-methoxyphenol hydroxylase-like FAD-dependent oxidoreductase